MLYENIKKLKKEESFRSWIFTILMNQCKKHFKQNSETEELKDEIKAEEVSQEPSLYIRSQVQRQRLAVR